MDIHSEEINPLVSIILPTYNVERYVEQCLNSLTNQTYKNIEIIVVIDGATDNSARIALTCAKKDPRILVIQQENQGSGPSRNNGIKLSRGKFIIFVDPDDWVDQDMVEVLVMYQKKYGADLVLSKSRTVDNQGKLISTEHTSGLNFIEGNDVPNNYLSLLGSGQLGAPTRKLYCREIIEKNVIRFPNLRRSQDIVFNYRYYDNVTSVLAVDDVMYNYRMQINTFSAKLQPDYYLILTGIYSEIKQLCHKWDVQLEGKGYSDACTYLEKSIFANIEADVRRRATILPIIKDENIKEIIASANPNRLDEILLGHAILNENIRTVRFLVYSRIVLKYLRSLL